MAAATTKSVTGFVTNLSAAEIDGAVLRFDLDPSSVSVDDNIIVGVQDGGVVGELVTPVADDGSFSIDIVAVDNPTWTITVTVDGPNIETPIPALSIIPPPLAGSGDVGIGSLRVAGTGGHSPVVVTTIRGAGDYDNTTDPTDGQAIVWNDTTKKYEPGTVAGGGGGGAVDSVNGHVGTVNLTYTDVGALPSSYTPPAAPVSSVAGRIGAVTLTASDVTGIFTQTIADARYLQDADTSKAKIIAAAEPVITYDEVAATWALRTTVTASATVHVIWSGPSSPPIGSGYAQDNFDYWRKTPPLSS